MKSITGKLMSSVTVLILFFIVLIYSANLLFIDDFFLWKTKKQFESELTYLTGIYNAEATDLLTVIRSRGAETGMKYTVSDTKGKIQIVSTPEFRTGKKIKISRENEKTIDKINDSFFYGIVERENSSKKDIILSGYLSPYTLIFISLPLEKLEENVRISNQFLLLIGSIVFLFSLLITYLFSRKAVKPIKELTYISEKIAELDFSHKYSGNRVDEIGDLGVSLNTSAEKLELFIANLKNEMTLQKRFTASISHELKSPVGLIRGYAEALSITVEDNEIEVKEYAGIILSESDRLTQLINDLLLLLKINSTSFKMEKSNFDLVETVRIILKKFSLIIKDLPIQIQIEAPETISISGDEKRLTQAIENVLSNAIKHCKNEGLISVRLTDNSGDIILSIANDGAHISENDLPHLFDPFYSAHQGRSRTTTGSGLGLSIVKSIVEKHDGTCSIHNTEGGVQFLIQLR